MARIASSSALYRALWRWHFYAGLIVAPFLLILSVTGAIYLFNDEINDRLQADLRFVTPSAERIETSRMLEAALAAHPGAATRIDMPASPDRSALVFIVGDNGQERRVAVDPGTGRVLGSFVYARTLVGWADRMHGSLTLGTIGDRIMELAACWTLVLIATGLYLWWPRGRKRLGGILFPRLQARGRVFWRDMHAVTGVWTMALIIFLILTGLPWAGVQGQVLRQVTAAAGIGYPDAHRNYGPMQSDPMGAVLNEAPWPLEDAPMPRSEPSHAGHAGPPGHGIPRAGPDPAAVAGIDAIVAGLANQGLTEDYWLFLPDGPEGVYTAITYPGRPQGQRTLYFDRYSGEMIREIGYEDYGWAARAIELGVQLHMGNYFGRANQILMLIPCIGIVIIIFSGGIMWWKRRPAGRLGAPPKMSEARLGGALLILAAAGILMPLLGASLIVMFLLDWLVRRTGQWHVGRGRTI